MEPNPGPDSNAPPQGLVRTLTENYERNTSGLHTDVHDQGDARENPPDALESTSHPPSEDTTEREPPRTGNLLHHPTTTQKGLVTPPLPPRRIPRHTHSTKTATTPWTTTHTHTNGIPAHRRTRKTQHRHVTTTNDNSTTRHTENFSRVRHPTLGPFPSSTNLPCPLGCPAFVPASLGRPVWLP